MKFIKTKLDGLFIIKPEPFKDNRGMFYRLYCENELKEIGFAGSIVQINLSTNLKKGTIRGMHFHYPNKTETKIVKCLKGSIYDVVIDIRKDSPTFLEWHNEIISDKNMKYLYIPEGFAHGFQTMEDNCEILYLHSKFYSSEYEGAIRYNDPKINITWPLEVSEISERDKNHKLIDGTYKWI